MNNGREALHRILGTEFDFVFMDIQMPVMDGLDATRRIRADERYEKVADIPIFALTAFAMAGDKEKCLQAGMNGYLSKPIDIAALEQTLNDHVAVRSRPPIARKTGSAA